jgi:hypothetical protein
MTRCGRVKVYTPVSVAAWVAPPQDAECIHGQPWLAEWFLVSHVHKLKVPIISTTSRGINFSDAM